MALLEVTLHRHYSLNTNSSFRRRACVAKDSEVKGTPSAMNKGGPLLCKTAFFLKNEIMREYPWMWAADTTHRFLDELDPKLCPVTSSEHLVASSGLMKLTKKYPRLAFFVGFIGKYKKSYVPAKPNLSRIFIAVSTLIPHRTFRIITDVVCASITIEVPCEDCPEDMCAWRNRWGNGTIDVSGAARLRSCMVPLSMSLNLKCTS